MKKTTYSHLIFAVLGMLLLIASCKKDDNPGQQPPVATDPGPNPGDLGTVSFNYAGQQVIYTSVRAKDGHIWLQQNLGASRVAISASDDDAYGDLYQWGRWADGHQVRIPTPVLSPASSLSANNPSGLVAGGIIAYISNWWANGATTDTWTAVTATEASATNGCDPCKTLGSGWSMPTDADWTMLIDSENITNTTNAFTSNLKIPNGGWRSTNSLSILSAGTSSWFWSSNAASTSGAKGVWILSTSVQKSYIDSRAYGTSVRCIKK